MKIGRCEIMSSYPMMPICFPVLRLLGQRPVGSLPDVAIQLFRLPERPRRGRVRLSGPVHSGCLEGPHVVGWHRQYPPECTGLWRPLVQWTRSCLRFPNSPEGDGHICLSPSVFWAIQAGRYCAQAIREGFSGLFRAGAIQARG